jgi:hypothetical protein
MINLPEDEREALRVLHVLTRNRTNQDFIWFFEWLEKEKERLTLKNLAEKDDVINRWQQGGCQLLDKLLDLNLLASEQIQIYSEMVARKKK